MEEHIVPECYFDTVLVKTLLKRKKVNHQKSCTKVESTVKGIDDFAVGIIDKDKKEVQYLSEFNEEINAESLILWKHKTKQHYFIQLAPAIEKWILDAADESKINLEELGIPKDLEKLKRLTKNEAVSENEQLKALCRQLMNGNGKSVNTLATWLNYLYDNNRNADINALK